MAKYVRLVRAMIIKFDECHFEHIPREENAKADALSKFASSLEESSGSVYFHVLKTRSIDVKLVAPIGLEGYGIPRILVTDNGTQFNNKEFKSIVKRMKSSCGSLLLHTLKPTDRQRWRIGTTCRITTGATPFMLAYGAKTVVPVVDISHSSPRIQAFNAKENEEGQKLDLDLIDEVRNDVHIKIVEYQRKTSFYYNLRVKERFFKQVDLVLRTVEASGVGKKGKLAPNWEGPYKVKSVQRGGSYKLETVDGEEVPRTWHAQNLKIYYI
ncbi:uncharacterized protein LOC141679330 [Apium graveolens]|uniref:uncharacterized protein LOC141679330 n=1 Tax=Apium graveolens TaxID=4045 RepID=UPI003D7BCFEF